MPTTDELQQQIDELKQRLEDKAEIEEIRQLLKNHSHDGIDTFNLKGKLTRTQKTGLIGGTDTTLHTHDDRYYTETEIDNAGYMSDLVDDTTPQLGGDLDANGNSYTAESGKIQRHFIYKALTDNTSTDLFDVGSVDSGDGAVILITCWAGVADSNGSEARHRKQAYLFMNHGGTITSNSFQEMYDDNADYDVTGGTGSSISVTFSASNPDSSTVRIATTVNTGSNNDPYFTAIIEIISNTNLTYTEQ